MAIVPPTYRLRAVVVGGMAAGVLDICYAIIFWAVRAGVPPLRILQSVASGLLGKAAYSGGWLTGLLGLALHMGMTVVMAFVFYAAARRMPGLVRHPLPAGMAYGLAIYGVMNFIVLPLSAFPNPQVFSLWPVVGGLLIHMLGVGVPIALFVQRALRHAGHG